MGFLEQGFSGEFVRFMEGYYEHNKGEKVLCYRVLAESGISERIEGFLFDTSIAFFEGLGVVNAY